MKTNKSSNFGMLLWKNSVCPDCLQQKPQNLLPSTRYVCERPWREVLGHIYDTPAAGEF